MALEQKDLDAFSTLMDEKLKGINQSMSASFRNINIKLNNQGKNLSRIETQTTKTNGRVNELEKKINGMELEEVKHIVNCPQIEAMNELRDDLEQKKADSNKQLDDIRKNLVEYDMLKKYPKIGLGVVAVSCIALVIATWSVLSNFMDNVRIEIKTEIQRELSDSINN